MTSYLHKFLSIFPETKHCILFGFTLVSLICIFPLNSQANQGDFYISNIQEWGEFRLSGRTIILPDIYIHDKKQARKIIEHHFKTMCGSVADCPIFAAQDVYGNYTLTESAQNNILRPLLENGAAVLSAAQAMNTELAELTELYEAENKARFNKLGFWQHHPKSPEDVQKNYGFVVVHGRIDNIHTGNKATFVNFSPEWRGRFRLLIDNNIYRHSEDLQKLEAEQEIEARGWLENYYGPILKIYAPAQVTSNNLQ